MTVYRLVCSHSAMNCECVLCLYSQKGRTPLSCAAEAGNDNVVGFLLSCRQTMSNGSIITTSPEGSGVSEVSVTMFLYVECTREFLVT